MITEAILETMIKTIDKKMAINKAIRPWTKGLSYNFCNRESQVSKAPCHTF